MVQWPRRIEWDVGNDEWLLGWEQIPCENGSLKGEELILCCLKVGEKTRKGSTLVGTQVWARGVEAGLRGRDGGGSEGQDKHLRRRQPRANGRVLTPCVQ